MKAVVRDWLEPSSMRWPDRESGPWAVTLTWRATGDRAECVGIHLAALSPETAEAVTATLLRRLPVATLIAAARAERFDTSGGGVVEAMGHGDDLDVGPGLLDQLRSASAPWAERSAGRPATLGQDHYREVARTYSAAIATGQSPLRAVERCWTVSRPTASRWIAAARRTGLLPPTERGRAKGDVNLLTDELGEQR